MFSVGQARELSECDLWGLFVRFYVTGNMAIKMLCYSAYRASISVDPGVESMMET